MREFWLYESKNKGKSVDFVREAKDEFRDFAPVPTNPWLRILPAPKLIFKSDHDATVSTLKAKLELAIDGLKKISTSQDGCEAYLAEETLKKLENL